MSKYPLQRGVPWTQKQIDEWDQIRQRGFRRFALKFGAMLTLFMVIGLALMYASSLLFQNPPAILRDLPIRLLPATIFTPFLGWYFGSILWRDFESQYQWTISRSGSATEPIAEENSQDAG